MPLGLVASFTEIVVVSYEDRPCNNIGIRIC